MLLWALNEEIRGKGIVREQQVARTAAVGAARRHSGTAGSSHFGGFTKTPPVLPVTPPSVVDQQGQ